MTAWIALALAIGTAVPAPARALGDELFSDLSFPEALEAAREQEKLVFIDFFTTWCAPCKRLDETTWKDPEVRAWLGERAISLKIDAEAEPDLAARWGVRAYPTLVFLEDGVMLDRLIGYRTAETFVREAESILRGETALSRARDEFAGHEDDPMARHRFAKELIRLESWQEAEKHLLWCWDRGLEKSPSFVGVRGSFLVSTMSELARSYEPFARALEERLQALLDGLRAGSGSARSYSDCVDLSRALGRPGSAVGLWDELDEPVRAVIRQWPPQELLDELAAAGRHEDYLSVIGTVGEYVQKRVGLDERVAASLEQKDPQLAELTEASRKNSFISGLTPVLAATAATGRRDDTGLVLAAIRERAPSPTHWHQLLSAVVSTGSFAGADQVALSALGPAGDRESQWLAELTAQELADPLAHTDPELARAIESGSARLFEVALEHGADVDAVWFDASIDRAAAGGSYVEATPPIVLAAREHPASVARLLAAGADPDARDHPGGRTALHEAALAGDAELATELLAAGADRALPDAEGETPAAVATGAAAEVLTAE